MRKKSLLSSSLLHISKISFFTALITTTTLYSETSHANGAANGVTSNASIVSYEPVYFEKFSPVTLLDMLQRIPGVQEVLDKNRNRGRRGRQQRGFGNGGDQILLDGKRLAGKTNNINDALSRISADQIARVDLIRGAAEGLDVQSQGLVINVIMKEGSSTSTTFWRMFGEYTFGYRFLPQFLVSHSGSTGNLQYTVTAERRNDDGFRPRFDEYFDGDSVKTGEEDIDHRFRFHGFKFNSNIVYSFEDGAEFRLNGLFEPTNYDFTENRIETGENTGIEFFDSEQDNKKWEVGGDYSRDLGFLGRSKTLFVINNNKTDKFIDRFDGEGSARYLYTNELTDTNRSEKIFRSSLTKNIFEKQNLEFGGEAAINTFDKKYDKSDRDSAEEILDLSTSDDVKIKENRYELFAIHSYQFKNNLLLQSSLTTEFSNIIADNLFADGSVNRRDTSFTYLKPRVNLRYDHTTSDQLRLTVEKKVSQLNFDNFVTSYNQQTDVITFGNTTIRPTQIWEFVFAYEHRFDNDGGSLEGQVFYHRRNDHITRVDFTDYVDYDGNPITVDEFFALNPTEALRETIRDGSGFTSKQGNIPNANIYGIDLKSSIRLGFVGVPEAVVNLGYKYEKRRSFDQFRQVMRDFSWHSDHNYNVGFRHDVTRYRFSYGFNADIRSDFASYDMRTYWPNSPSANISAFAEYNMSNGMKMRMELIEISGSKGHTTLYNYTDHIRFDELSKITEKENDKPRAIKVSVEGSF